MHPDAERLAKFLREKEAAEPSAGIAEWFAASANWIEAAELDRDRLVGKLEEVTKDRTGCYAKLGEYLDLCFPKAKPSCLVCGRADYDEPKITHMTLGSIVVCERCATAPSRLDNAAKLLDCQARDCDQRDGRINELERRLDAIKLAAETGEGSSQLTHTKAALRRILEILSRDVESPAPVDMLAALKAKMSE